MKSTTHSRCSMKTLVNLINWDWGPQQEEAPLFSEPLEHSLPISTVALTKFCCDFPFSICFAQVHWKSLLAIILGSSFFTLRLFLKYLYWDITDKLHNFKIYILVNFEIGTRPWNHHHNQDNEHIHHPRKFPRVHLSLLSSSFPFSQTTTDLLFITWLVCIFQDFT